MREILKKITFFTQTKKEALSCLMSEAVATAAAGKHTIRLSIWLVMCAMCFNLWLSAIHYEYLMIFFFLTV
jgi:hypothetical protein